ncbi:MAG: response regulator transcription factor [Clostridiales bacterium]|nr:response regulator transcription factor [Clostridiales bacterium]
MARILIYGTDESVSRKLALALRREGYAVECRDVPQALPAPIAEPTLVVLDARLKWSVCRPLFHEIQTAGYPVLFLTADQEMMSHLRALYRGPSDVLMLPLSPKVALVKAQMLLRHMEPMRELTVVESERVAVLDGERVELTAQEFALLLALMENPDMPISREQLLRKAWGYQSIGETRTVDVHVQRLRKKLGVERIETVYKCGYRLKMA